MDRRQLIFCTLVTTFVIFAGLGDGQATEPTTPTPIRWQSDLQAAHRESLRSNRPVLIVFGAEWCHFCKKLEKESLAHPQIAPYINQSFVPLHLDFDESQRETEILNVKAIPCVVVLTPQAELVGRLDGFATPQKVAEMLTKSTRLQSQIQQARYAETARRNTMTPTR
ncbi:MAG: thioredoxin family protein [Planctomycetaceae bacterium]|nr:thioredoxin family protein [Planctomycetaceae bacterium]